MMQTSPSKLNPAIVSHAGARPLARWALFLVCAAYLLPGQFGRDAWRHADLTAFGYISALAKGQSSWWLPTLGGQATQDGALLPYWIGAVFMKALPGLEPALAARLPFIAALALVLVCVWRATFHLGRTEAAQPVSFAFGGEAGVLDYARALADAAVLAMVASLGLLQLGHETTPELFQLLGASLWLYALAIAPYRWLRAQGLAVMALLVLALSGAAQFALFLGTCGLVICQYSRFEGARQLRLGLLMALALVVCVAFGLNLWRWRLYVPEAGSTLRLVGWFGWPTAVLACWTVWRWRHFLGSRHVSVPLTLALLGLLACVAMGGSDRALLLSLPALAVLASFALPTLNRNLSAMVDWFSVFFFSAGALFPWAYYLGLQTDWFPGLSRNVERLLASNFSAPFEPVPLAMAVAATLAWVQLVRWRTSRQRAALWRSLVLPAGGTALAWLLFMTLHLPLLNHVRSNQALLGTIRTLLPASINCVSTAEQNLSLAATLEALGDWKVVASGTLATTSCNWAVRVVAAQQAGDAPSGWLLRGSVLRPSERNNRYQVLERQPHRP
jgi:hypothetical protein